jgi:hypothetical protein
MLRGHCVIYHVVQRIGRARACLLLTPFVTRPGPTHAEMADAPSAPPAAPGDATLPAPVNALQPRPPAKYQLVPPRLLPCGIQFSVHEVPRAFGRELELVLPGVPLEGLLVVPTCQKACCDLLETGPVVAAEKDALLEKVR